jgi:hypothetical protein
MTSIRNINSRYIQNPDIILREEDEDGGLLFNPDTGQVKVVNSTGLFIWKQFATSNDLETVVSAIKANYEDVPDQEVVKDISGFLELMVEKGFIGNVQE